MLTLLIATGIFVGPTPIQKGKAALQELLERQQKDVGFPGACFSVSSGGEQPTRLAIGIGDASHPVPLTGSEPFLLASANQIVMGTLTALTVERGELRWTTTIRELFPELVSKIRAEYLDANVYDISCNRSGIPGGANYDEMYKRWKMPPAQGRYSFMSEYALHLAPTDKSSDQHGLPSSITLACVLERATHKSLEDLARARLIEGMGMKSLGFDLPVDETGRLFGLASHERKIGGFRKVDVRFRGRVGFYCNSDDFVKIGNLYTSALRGQSALLSQQTARLMTKRHPRGAESPAWRATANGDLFYAGDAGGHYTLLYVDLRKSLSIGGCVNLAGDEGGMKAAHGFVDAARSLYR